MDTSPLAVLHTPWDDELRSLCASVKHELRLCVPFVKRNALHWVLTALPATASIRLISSLSIALFHQGYSDTAAFRDLLQRRGRLRAHPYLHAKLYIFDDHAAVITSANLTAAGLKRNWEYGVLMREREMVSVAAADFEELWEQQADSEIQVKLLDTIDRIVTKLPPAITTAGKAAEGLPDTEADEPAPVLHGAGEVLRRSLTGWKRAVFEVLNEIGTEVFTLQDDVYRFAPRLKALYPGNYHVEAKIRQQLQLLRDLGLVEFLGAGKYRRLWT